MSNLSNKQQAFIDHYILCWSAAEAARRAGYSNATARQQGSRLLTNVDVQAEIERRAKELHASADEVLMRLALHSRGNMDDFISPLGLIDIDKARERGAMALVKRIKQRTTTVSRKDEDVETHDIEIELYDAQAATVQLARILGQFVERIEVRDWREKARARGLDPDVLVSQFKEMILLGKAKSEPDGG